MVNSAVLKTAPGPWSGWLNGLLGVIIFSGSLPATRLAVLDMDPFLLTFLRASIAGLLAIALLAGFRQKRPRASQPCRWPSSRQGGDRLSAAHGAGPAARHVSAFDRFIGLLPLMTAILAYCAAENVRAALSGSFRLLAACWWWDSP